MSKSAVPKRATNRSLCGHAGNERGYAYFNEDTGEEWSTDHPVLAGTVPDATDIRPMRFATFRQTRLST